ncbi:hypothetical protein ACE6H2_021241 [Prunus campanulata]
MINNHRASVLRGDGFEVEALRSFQSSEVGVIKRSIDFSWYSHGPIKALEARVEDFKLFNLLDMASHLVVLRGLSPTLVSKR